MEHNIIPNGDHCPIAVVLLNVSGNTALEEYLNLDKIFTRKDPILSVTPENATEMSATLLDIVSFGKGSSANKSQMLLAKLVPAWVSGPVHPQQSCIGSISKKHLSLSRCPIEGDLRFPHFAQPFQLAVPSPFRENVCCMHGKGPITAGIPGGHNEEPPPKRQKESQSGGDHHEEQEGINGDGNQGKKENNDDEQGDNSEDQAEDAHGPNSLNELRECFMKDLGLRGYRTACGAGDLVQLDTLVMRQLPESVVESMGVHNMADLILSRGAGIFNWEDQDLAQWFVCPKHREELGMYGREWERTWRKINSAIGRVAVCAMPKIEGLFPHSQPVPAIRTRQRVPLVLKQESLALLKFKDILFQVGMRKLPVADVDG